MSPVLAHGSWLLAPSPALLATKSPPCTQNLGLSEAHSGSGSACPQFVWKSGVQGAGHGLVPSPHASHLRHRTHQKTLTLLQHGKAKGRARAEVAGAVAGVELA